VPLAARFIRISIPGLFPFLAFVQLCRKSRIRALPGFGDMKVLALSAVLSKRFGVEVATPLAPSFPTLGDVDSVEALHEYQAAKRAHKAARRAQAQH